jgi:hypothetical protein
MPATAGVSLRTWPEWRRESRVRFSDAQHAAAAVSGGHIAVHLPWHSAASGSSVSALLIARSFDTQLLQTGVSAHLDIVNRRISKQMMIFGGLRISSRLAGLLRVTASTFRPMQTMKLPSSAHSIAPKSPLHACDAKAAGRPSSTAAKAYGQPCSAPWQEAHSPERFWKPTTAEDCSETHSSKLGLVALRLGAISRPQRFGPAF